MANATISQVARALNLSEQRIHQLVRLGLPRASRGQYELGACLMWYVRYLQDALRGKSSGDDSMGSMSSLMKERTALTRVNRERSELEQLKATGQVVLISRVSQQLQGACAHLNQILSSLPKRVSNDETLQAKIKDELDVARNEFANHFASLIQNPAKRRLAQRRDAAASRRLN